MILLYRFHHNCFCFFRFFFAFFLIMPIYYNEFVGVRCVELNKMKQEKQNKNVFSFFLWMCTHLSYSLSFVCIILISAFIVFFCFFSISHFVCSAYSFSIDAQLQRNSLHCQYLFFSHLSKHSYRFSNTHGNMNFNRFSICLTQLTKRKMCANCSKLIMKVKMPTEL